MEVTEAGTAKNGEQYCGAGSSVGTALNSRDAVTVTLLQLCYRLRLQLCIEPFATFTRHLPFLLTLEGLNLTWILNKIIPVHF